MRSALAALTGSAALCGFALADGAPARVPAKAPAPAAPTVKSAPVGAGFHCVYPWRETAAPESAALRATPVAESEPNDTLPSANILALSEASPAFDVAGSLTSADVDLYRVELQAGQWLNAAMVAPTTPDSKIAILDAAGVVQMSNDDDGLSAASSQSATYPEVSPLLRTSGLNPIVAWLAPQTGTYYIRVVGFNNVQVGAYSMNVRLLQGGFETLAPGARQIFFVDFDGAELDAQAVFGGGNSPAVLSPMSSFLASWGLANTAANRNAVIDGVMAKIVQNLDEISALAPSLDYELRNSRDHTDPFGQPNVSRLIVGGTQGELGIGTIGLAQSVDPGNFDRGETAVILLDTLSSPFVDISAQNVPRAAGVSIFEAIARGVGNIASHEAGHLLGAWHTDSTNLTPCLIDSGGGFLERNIYDTGPDEVIGTPDDVKSSFRTDEFAFESIAESGSIENAGHRVAAGLRTGSACIGDLSGDGQVDGADLGLLLGAWGAPGTTDLNADGATDGADLGLLLGAWGAC